MSKISAVLFALASLSPALRAAPRWESTLPAALAAAKTSARPVLIDFQAPWCYSCYFMEGHVLNGAAFARAADKLVLLKVDVDQEEGRALKEKFRVTFLPTYVVVDAQGESAGRVVGEQTETDFLAKLGAITAGTQPSAEDAALAALRARLAAGKDDAGGTLVSLKELLDKDLSCELAYDVETAAPQVDALPAEKRKAWLEAEAKPLERLVEAKALKGACADFRTPIEMLGAVYDHLGRAPDATSLYARAVAYLESLPLKVGQDRNRDDNLRFFLEAEKADEKTRALYAQLIDAYPLDYVYAFRFARYLEEHGKPAEAAPWIEKADKLCYGANRLAVTKVRAQILASLGRKTEARALLDRDIRAGEKYFPKEVAALRAELEELSR